MADRPRKLIVHAGMHKTGSTAIQYWLKTSDLKDAHYFDWREANHSNLFVLLFEENPQEYFGLARSGYTRDNAMRDRESEKARIRQQIETSDRDLFIFSAERISAAPDQAVQAMHDFFAEFFADIQVYAYVRKPSGFMTSMFQQHLKTGSIKLKFGKLWPHYRRRLARLPAIFGADNVHLRSFDRLVEEKTDAVGDFAKWVGMSAVPPKNIVRNQSMKASGMALLCFYRKYIEPDLPADKRAGYDRHMVKMAQSLPGESFHIELEPDARLRRLVALDLEWIEAETGLDFDDLGVKTPGVRVFRDEDEILRYAINVSHLLAVGGRDRVLDPDGPRSHEKTVARFQAFLLPTSRARSFLRLPLKRRL